MIHSSPERRFGRVGFSIQNLTDKVSMRLAQISNEGEEVFANSIRVENARGVSGFKTRELLVSSNIGQRHFIAVELTEGTASFQASAQKNRKTSITFPHMALPLGPVYGEYHSGDPSETRGLFFTSSETQKFGSEDIVDRFPVEEPDLNSQYSGGLVIENGNVCIVDQEQLRQKAEEGMAAAQTFFSWNSKNYADLMNQSWHHFGVSMPIGISQYTWSWYVEIEGKLFFIAPRYFRLGNNNSPIHHINQINNVLSQGKLWKAALCDSGLGGGFVIRSGNGVAYSNHPNPEYFHTIPLYLLVGGLETPEIVQDIVPKTRPVAASLDAYFRKPDTILAKSIKVFSSPKGEKYLRSRQKRTLDVMVGIPLATIAAPVIGALAALKKLEDGGPAFFVQERVLPESFDANSDQDGEPLKTSVVFKLRTMRPNSDNGKQNIDLAHGKQAWEDPRSTAFGVLMRKHYLDELPQLYQVLLGQYSLIGIRAPGKYIIDFLKNVWSRERFERWRDMCKRGKFGLSGVNQLFGSQFKEDEKRFHMDVFYAKHASLGLDLYLLWRTFTKLTKLLK